MEIEFDPAKDRDNRKAHDGLSLALARDLDWDFAVTWEDRRFFYEEVRMNSIVPGGDRLYFVTYTERGERLRIISLRYAGKSEIRHYGNSYH
jgi:uncharacterized DUF497 family protein